ncbi:MAG: ABC transporter permease [Clostridium sp.]
MRTLEYIKITIKNLMSNFQVSILYFIGLPLIIGAVMGFMNDTLHGAEDMEINPVKIYINDEDKTEKSDLLIDFLKSSEANVALEIINNDGEQEATVIIPNGYENSISKSEKNSIIIKENDTPPIRLQIVKELLNSYHMAMYDIDNDENIKASFEVIQREEKQIDSTYAFYSVSMLSFVIGMLILSMVTFTNDKKYRETNKRVYTTPNCRWKILNMKSLTNLIYIFITILLYCLAYRISGVAFTGNILILIMIVTIAATVITSMIAFITTVFGEKYSKVISSIIFMLPIVGGGTFFESENILANLSITKYIGDLFKCFERTNAITSKMEIGVVLIATACILYGITMIVEKKREGKNEADMVNLG